MTAESWITISVAVGTTALGSLVTAARAIQKLSDHTRECDTRYKDLASRFERVEQGVEQIRDVLMRPPGH